MKKLQLAIAAILVLGLVDQAQARSRCNKGSCYKSAKVCAKACEPEECTKTCVPRIEEQEITEKITICVPRRLTRECKDVTTTCVKKATHCENAPWKKDSCTVKIDCGHGDIQKIELPGDDCN